MTKIDELRAKVTEATARADKAATDGDEAAETQANADETAAVAEVVTELTRIGLLAGKRLERAGRAAATAGGYQIGHFDIAVGLPQVDPAKIPAPVILLRSPTPEVRKRYVEETTDGNGVDAETAAINEICTCTIAPTLTGPEAIRYRVFWETTGRGMINRAVAEIVRLGGMSLTAFQRASK